jgi:hypothetical protein
MIYCIALVFNCYKGRNQIHFAHQRKIYFKCLKKVSHHKLINLFLPPCMSFGGKLKKLITIVKQLEMQDVPYAIVVSKLMYLVTGTCLDLAYVVGH